MLSLEEQANLVKLKLLEIWAKVREMVKLCDLILHEDQIDSEVFTLPKEDKQKLLTYYANMKASLQSLVNELPS